MRQFALLQVKFQFEHGSVDHHFTESFQIDQTYLAVLPFDKKISSADQRKRCSSSTSGSRLLLALPPSRSVPAPANAYNHMR
jgi:hypothetical protein